MAAGESADEVEALLSMATEVVPGSSTLQLAGISNLEGNIITEVSMSELKPIVMTMANMANISYDNNFEGIPEPASVVQISDRSETVLASHLLSVTPSTSTGRPARVKQKSSEVYRDSSTGVTYEIQRGGTRRGGDKLIDSLGFTYNLKAGKGNRNISYWWCAVRNQQLRCPAAVTQKGNVFMRGKRKHEHLVGQSIPKPSYDDKLSKNKKIKPGRPVGSIKAKPSAIASKASRDFKIIKHGSKAGMDLLRDCLGYSYTLKKVSHDGLRIQWRCSVRNKYVTCPATASQNGQSFMPGTVEHLHLPGNNRPVDRLKNEYNAVNKRGGSLIQEVIGGGKKTYWCCSVRNKHLRCPASVIQYEDSQFVEGSFEHKHLPSFNIPAGPHEHIPSLRQMREQHELDDSESEYDDDMTDHSYGTSKASGSVYLNSGKVVSTAASRIRVPMSREKKRREHQTFLGPRCTINLTKCDDPTCNCRLVHCPFCDKHHFKPTKAGRVQDHLELTHFAHGVQYDDLMIVKCFHDCDLDKSYGHYHCVFCFRQMLKRTAYARHMLRHMMKMGIPDRLLVLPDSKFPDIINAYGYEIPICKTVSCGPPNQEKHYHCPSCSHMCRERSLTVNHLWRCLQKKRDGITEASDDPDEDIVGVVDEDQLVPHFSLVKSFKDIPVDKCMSIDCCHQNYHCKLCPENVFIPTYRQHLIAHYVTHWKQRVLYKNFSILKCFHPCDGVDRSMCKTRYHYHCPICSKIILTKGTFEEHLRTCHMFRFGENLIQNTKPEFDTTFEDDISLGQETAPLNENVEFMEDQLTAQAIKNAEKVKQYKGKSKISKGKKWKSSWNFKKGSKAMVKQEMNEGESVGKGARPIGESDVYELCSAIISPKLARKVKSTSHLRSILGGVAGATSVKLSTSDNGQYLLTGPAEELLDAQKMLTKKINKEIKGDKKTLKVKVKEGVKYKRSTSRRKKVPVISSKSSEAKGRGRPKKETADDNSFPYSEIRQIIEASKDKSTDTPKRGRGRPPKNPPGKPKEEPKKITIGSPLSTKQKSGQANIEKPNISSPDVQRTPGRYSTRGVRKNYLEMNSGGYRREIKQEPLSDSEDVQIARVDTDKKSGVGKRRGRPPKKYGRTSSTDDDDKIEKEEDIEEQDDELDGSDEEVNEELDETDEGDDIEEVNDEQDNSGLEEEDMDDSLSLFDDSDDDIIDEENDIDDENDDRNSNDMETERNESIEDDPGTVSTRAAESGVKELKTSQTVTTNVPSVFKLGMRQSNLPKIKSDNDIEEEEERAEMGSDKADNKCSLCENHKAESFADLTEHLKTFHHVYDPPRCDICEADFDTVQSLNVHIDKKHGPLPEKIKYVCDYPDCGKEFISNGGLVGHANRVHFGVTKVPNEKRYSCENCSYKCNSVEDIFEHKKIEHNEQIQCEECKKVFQSYQSLKSHNQLTHSTTSVSCKVCNKAFSNKSYMNKHMKSHFTSTSFTCHICNKVLRSKISLRDHLETHKDPSERTYSHVCTYCGKQFALKSNLNDHINKHTGARPYKCDICLKAFGFRSMLMKHKTFVHSSERPFKCGVCHKDFKFMNLLQNHLTTHTNTSKHVCPHCSKMFSTASTLKFHSQKCRGLSWKRNLVAQVPPPQETLLVYTEPIDNVKPAEPADQSVLEPEIEIVYDNATEENQALVYQSLEAQEDGSAIQEIETVVEEEPKMVETEVEMEPVPVEPAQNTIEVYACSECKATFNTYNEAETHVLTAHSAVPAQSEETMEFGTTGI